MGCWVVMNTPAAREVVWGSSMYVLLVRLLRDDITYWYGF